MGKKLWKEKKFTKILQEVGIGNYHIFKPEEPFTSVLYSSPPSQLPDGFMGVCLSTANALAISHIDFIGEDFVIPKSSPIVVWRTFRYCMHDGVQHLNAEDSVIFNDEKGNVWKADRHDSPDHYLPIATWAGLQHIAEAFHLPTESYGPYSKYVENGASLYVKLWR